METNDAVPLSFDIGPYQGMFNVQLENLSVKRQLDEGIFWNELVNSVAEAWKAVDVRSLTLELFRLMPYYFFRNPLKPIVDDRQRSLLPSALKSSM